MPIPSDEVSFDCLVKDYLGPLMPTHTVEFNCALVLYDINTSYPLAFLFRSLSAKKNMCNAFLQLFQITGIPSAIRSDCGSNFTNSLTTTFPKLLRCTPNFNVPYRPQQSGLCERLIGTLKSMISKVAAGQPNQKCGTNIWALFCGRQGTPLTQPHAFYLLF